MHIMHRAAEEHKTFSPWGSKHSNRQWLSGTGNDFPKTCFPFALPSPTIKCTGKAKVKSGLEIFLLPFKHTKFGGKEFTYCSYTPLSRNISTTKISFLV